MPNSNSISLNILTPAATKGQREGKVKRSRAAKWRAVTLLTVNGLIAARLAWWLANDKPPIVSPVEPSEALAFSKDNIINAGAIFFLLMIVSTMILGRFFCGWACHFLALQDGARWILLKLGIRPKPFRSRLLGLVPLGAFLYMFIWPLAYRAWLFAGNVRLRISAGDTLANALAWANAQPFAFPTPQSEIVRAGFWDTFPGVAVAIFSFAVAGAFIVYVLGAKGFCFYACPYGGIFGPVDKLAPFRIRVNEDCDHTGHCTSVCSSNVRVHEEVRDYGMVVDPGCMKCLDCVSVCPNDALRWGVGKPALFARPRREPDIHHPKDFSGKEEFALAALFLVTLYAIHSLYDVFPFLVSLGVSSIVAYLLLVTARTFYKPTVRALRTNLKLKGRRTSAGLIALPIAAILVAFIAHSAFIQHRLWQGTKLYDASAALRNTAINAGTVNALSDQDQSTLRDALAYINTTLSSTPFPLAKQEIQQAWLLCALGQHERFIDEAAQAAGMFRNTKNYESDVARALIRAGRMTAAEAVFKRVADRHQSDAVVRATLAELIAQNPNRLSEAREFAEAAIAIDPESVPAVMANARLIALSTGNVPGAIDALEALKNADSLTVQDITSVSLALFELGAAERALDFIDTASPSSENPQLASIRAVDLLVALGRPQEAIERIKQLADAPDASPDLLRFAANWLATQANDLPAARIYIDRVVAQNPNQPDIITLQGDILDGLAFAATEPETATDLRDRSRAAYTRALERLNIERRTMPENPNVLRDLAAVHARLGDFAETEHAARRATELNPNDPVAWQYLAISLQELGRPDEAAQAAQRGAAITGQ